jgi:glycosyltransferase involved in cell wall biosynthesis
VDAPRILFLAHSGSIGGAELSLLSLVQHFGDHASVVLFADGPYRMRLEEAGASVRVLDGGPYLHGVRRETRVPDPRAMFAALSLARKVARLGREYDLLYANSQKAFVIGCAASVLCRRPLLWHLRDILTRDHFSSANIRLDVTLANLFATRVVSVSRAARDAFTAAGGAPDRIHVVHNGVDARPFLNVRERDVAAVRDGLGLAPGQKLIGLVSRISPWKGQDLLVRTIAGMPDVHVILVGGTLFGEEAYETALHAVVDELGVRDRVHFLGIRDDVPVLMSACDLLVHAATAPEPFGRVVIEGMLVGKPIVAPRAGGVVELLEDGVTGMLYDEGSAKSLGEAIALALADPERSARIGAAASRHALSHMSLESMVKGVEEQVLQAVNAGK